MGYSARFQVVDVAAVVVAGCDLRVRRAECMGESVGSGAVEPGSIIGALAGFESSLGAGAVDAWLRKR